MRRNKNIAISSLITGLLATSIVTACVKNGSKNEDPQTQGLKTLEVTALSGNELNGIVPVQFLEDSDVASNKLIKEYSFDLTEVREFRVSPGEVKNEGCRDGGPFIYAFSLIDSNGQERPLHSRKNPELLAPGAYKLRLELENGSLCRKVSMEINVRSKVRSDLVMTNRENRGYQCNSVEENGAIQTNTSVRVNTSPMKVVKYQTVLSGEIRQQNVVDENNLCGRELKENVNCIDVLNPASKEDRPVSATKRICRSNNAKANLRALGQAVLQVNRRHQRNSEFTCRHRRKVVTFELGACDLLFNLGQNLPLRAGSTEIVVRRDRMRVNYDLINDSVDEDKIPSILYAGVVIKRENSFYENLSNSYTEINREDFIDGQLVIRDQNIRRKIMANGIENVEIVISERPNIRRGLYSFSLTQVCSHPDNSVMEKKGGDSNDLCE